MVPSFNSLLEIDTAGLGPNHLLRYYRKGEVIPCSQGVWQVYKGVVQLSTLYPNGEEGLLGWVGPSMCFGTTLTCLQTYQAKALSDVYVMGFSISQIEASPQLSQQLVPQLSRRLRQMEALLAIVGLRRVEERLYQLLGLLKQELGQPVEEGIRLTIRLTHQDLAGAIGTSRVTVTRLLGQLKKQGIITFDNKRHLVIKEALLTQATDSLFIRHLEEF